MINYSAAAGYNWRQTDKQTDERNDVKLRLSRSPYGKLIARHSPFNWNGQLTTTRCAQTLSFVGYYVKNVSLNIWRLLSSDWLFSPTRWLNLNDPLIRTERLLEHQCCLFLVKINKPSSVLHASAKIDSNYIYIMVHFYKWNCGLRNFWAFLK